MSFKFPNKRLKQHNSLKNFDQNAGQGQLKPFEIKKRLLQTEDILDSSFGYARYTGQVPKTAFIFNIRETLMLVGNPSSHDVVEHQAIDMYCLQEDGSTFKTTYIFHPYFLLLVKDTQAVPELEEWLGRQFRGIIENVQELWKEDLDLPNHLSGKKQRFIKLTFRTTSEMYTVRRDIQRMIDNRVTLKQSTQEYYSLGETTMIDSSHHINFGNHSHGGNSNVSSSNTGNATGDLDLAREQATMSKIHGDKRQAHEKVPDSFVGLREYDVPYVQRISIDTQLRCGLWYDFFTVSGGTNSCSFSPRKDLESRPQMRIMAYDIETCKAPLKFPNSEVDQIMMISLMMDGQGLLITNRQIVSEDIDDFEYTPKPEYEGPFKIINTPNERTCIEAFFDYIKQTKPQVIVTYNGDFFDFPYVDTRALKYGISMADQLGITLQQDLMSSEYKGRFIVHLDAFCWVQRDSYLPQGSQGLKAVTKAKLKYDPIELDPEDMMPFARIKPKELAQYSVSDAVATYYLYLKYVHLFIFSLCTIIPLTPSEVLRKGSGTLCETLLMVQAYEHNVIAPNKQHDDPLKFYQGHLLESETYVGGHVECLHSGVYRSDIPIKFELKQAKLKELMDSLDSVLHFAITKEWKKEIADVTNYDEIRTKIYNQLEHLYNNPVSYITPFIYHLDVGAMYPNIILTNRLQPYAVVDEVICATCDYNKPNAICKRTLEWTWRGKYYVPTKADYASIRASLEFEPLSQADKLKFNIPNNSTTGFQDIHVVQQAEIIKNRVKNYARKMYRKLTEEKIEHRHATTCQREHPFYIDTVRAFRDRRYLYKELNKTWGDNLGQAKKSKDALREQQCKDMILLYDSMQLAHKCILNSFYGYVMRKGSRWSSMPMAGVVTRTGAKLIQRAEDLVCSVGKVLELDTDGIWCVLPSTFPENFKLTHKNGSIFKLSFPCSVLNHQVDDKHTNHQYHQVPDEYWKSEAQKEGKPPEYKILSECSIFFEVDGPYKAMVLPASQHEGKNIKKRYAVFNFDGSLAELKGFEIKRRGELKLIKVFQEDVFKVFLKGKDLIECYEHVGSAANKWLDVLFSRGQDLEDSVVFDLVSENKSMSERLEHYGNARSTSITCARRLGEFLGAEMVKDKGLNCHFVIVRYPIGAPVSERAVPVKIWDSPDHIKKYYLRQWLNENTLQDFDIRSLLDWEYYTTRLNSAIQKIITIPAAFQEVLNPVPRVIHPDWLQKQLKKKSEPQDKNVLEMMRKKTAKSASESTSELISTNTTGSNKIGMFKGFGGHVKSVFEQLEDDDDDDFEDFGNIKKKNSKLHPAFKKNASTSVYLVDKDGNEIIDKTGNRVKNSAQFESIDDDDNDLNFSTTLTKKNSKKSTMIDHDGADLEAEYQKIEGQEPAPEGTVAWLKQRQVEWIREARQRRRIRERHNSNDLTTAGLVAQFDKKIKAEIKAKIREDMEEKIVGGGIDHDEYKYDEDGNIVIENDLDVLNSDNDDDGNDDDDDDDEIIRKREIAFQLEEERKKIEKKNQIEAGEEKKRKELLELSQHAGLYKTWHIISIQPHPIKPGVFSAWINVQNNPKKYDPVLKKEIPAAQPTFKMQKITFSVDRHFYIHSRTRDPILDDFGTIITNKILPHGVQTHVLYEIVLDEATWQRDKQSILDHILPLPNILGIYQHDLSLLFKTIIDLGNIVHGLDEQSVQFDTITKRPILKLWSLEADLVTHSNIKTSNPQTNSFDKYLLTPQDIHKEHLHHHHHIHNKPAHSTTLTDPSLSVSITNPLNNTDEPKDHPSTAPLFIFHRENHDLYLQNSPSQQMLDRQRVFFAIFDPTALEIVIIAAGPGTQSYQNSIGDLSPQQLTAHHSKLLAELTHDNFIQWLVSSHVSSYYQSLSKHEILLLQTSNVNVMGDILAKKLKISTKFSAKAADAYKYLNSWLFQRNNDSKLPILPNINTTQDMALITSLLFHQQTQQAQQEVNGGVTLTAFDQKNLNKDYSLSFIISSYPFLYTHFQLPYNQLNTHSHGDPQHDSGNSKQQNNIATDLDNPFATLQWVSNSIQSMYNNISDMYADFCRRLHLSRLTKVPLCNVPPDIPLYILDVFFARALLDHHHIIWSNRSSIIDLQSQYLSTTNNNINAVMSYSNYFGTYNVPCQGQINSGGILGPNSSSTASSGSVVGSGNTTTELDLMNPQLMNPGCYHSICFDFDLQDFTLNALMNFGHLPDQAENDTLVSIHGTAAAQNSISSVVAGKEENTLTGGGGGGVVVTTDPSSVIFRIFRTLISHFVSQRDHFRYFSAALERQVEQFNYYIDSTSLDEYFDPLLTYNDTNASVLRKNTRNGNPLVAYTPQQAQFKQQQLVQQLLYSRTQLLHVELLINSIYRYITSSQYSILYDHMLHVYIHRLMKKTLILLIKEITRLHSIIIYSSFERLLICTDKTHIDIAVSRVHSILGYVKKQPLFSKLNFNPSQVFHTLLFMDVYNYAGICHQPPPDDDVVIYDSGIASGHQNGHNNVNEFDQLCEDVETLADPHKVNQRLKQHEAEWNEREMSQKFQEQLQIATGVGNGYNKGVKKAKSALDMSSDDDYDDYDDDENVNDDNYDDINADISIVDVSGDYLRKKQNKSRFNSLMSDLQIDFGQFEKKKQQSNDMQYLDTLPIDDDDVCITDYDDDDGDDNNNNHNHNKPILLNDPLSPLKSGSQRPKQTLSSQAALREERRRAKYANMRKEMNDEADQDEYEAELEDRANRLDKHLDKYQNDDEYLSSENSEIDDDRVNLTHYDDNQAQSRKQQRRKAREHIYSGLDGFFDDSKGGNNSKNVLEYQKNQKNRIKNYQNDKDDDDEDVLMAVRVTEAGFNYNRDDFGDEDGIPNNTTTYGSNLDYQHVQTHQKPHEEWIVQQYWNIGTFLPRYGEELFSHMVEMYLKLPFLAFNVVEQEELAQSSFSSSTDPSNHSAESELAGAGIMSNLNGMDGNSEGKLIKTMEGKKRHQWYEENLKTFLELDIQQLLLEQISALRNKQDQHVRILRDHALALQHHQNGGNDEVFENYSITNINDDSVFPSRPGKFIHMTNVALEYIKLYCHVLSLDQYCVDQIVKLKSTCLTKLQVQPFTQLSHYQQPCRTFVLPNVCCSRCGVTKDTDLCRDISLFLSHDKTRHSTPTHSGDATHNADTIFGNNDNGRSSSKWFCQYCNSPYNKAEIEARLINIVQQIVQKYQQQDFMCPKCKEMKSEMLSTECSKCCIPYVCSMTYRAQKQIMISLFAISKQHRFIFLEQQLFWLLAHR